LNAVNETAVQDSPIVAASRLYALLGECFAYPDADLADDLRNGALARVATELVQRVDPALVDRIDLRVLADATADAEALAVEYTRLFDASDRGTLCSLNGGAHVGPQMTVMEEAIRFYTHFGLTLNEHPKELPDHLTTQLNFLHFLTYGECARAAEGAPSTAYRLARRDFIARHPGRWVPIMLAKLRTAQPLPFFLVSAELVAALLAWDVARLERDLGTASTQPSGRLPFDGI